ncbi:hypothetical protein Tco_1557486, partial [Tanacetum coccineum]
MSPMMMGEIAQTLVESAPNKRTNKSRVSIVDDDARTKDKSDKENVDVIGSTSSRKDTRNG